MQNKMIVRYLYEGKLVQSKYLKTIMNSRQIKRMAENKINIPKFPTLLKYDFSDQCFDSTKIFYEFLNEAEMAMNENLNEDICNEIDESPSMSM